MKIIQKITFTGMFIFLLGQSQAQKLSPAELNAGSGSGSNSAANIALNYSIGNAFGTSTVALSISLNTTNGREATEQDVEGLPEHLQNQILSARAGLKAWPVPSEGPVQLLLEGTEEGTEAQVFDRTGKLILSVEIFPGEPRELHLPESGIYFIRTSDPRIPTVRIVRN